MRFNIPEPSDGWRWLRNEEVKMGDGFLDADATNIVSVERHVIGCMVNLEAGVDRRRKTFYAYGYCRKTDPKAPDPIPPRVITEDASDDSA